MLRLGIRARVILATCEEALERGRVDSGLAELPGSLRGRSEALDRIAVPLLRPRG